MGSEHLSLSVSMAHILMASSPGQGHINPLLRLAKLLASNGMLVTFTTDAHTGGDMIKGSNITPHELIPVGDGFISFEFFPDGWLENDPRRADLEQYMTHLGIVGKDAVSQIVSRQADKNRPVSCLIHSPFIPWVSDVAEEFRLPSAMLWIQSCACFAAYYSYEHRLVQFPTESDPKTEVQLPCMPLLKHNEVPSFLHPSTQYPFLARIILGQFKKLNKVSCVLMETFQELEPEIVEYMSKLCPIKTVGPLFKYPILQSSAAVRGDFVRASEGSIEWLDTKPASSVVYVSFGSVVYLQQEQVNEIAHGLLNAGVSFLWVMKQPHQVSGLKQLELPEGFFEKVGDSGKVVGWSPQEKVLAHPSVACFVTHCGWNSTIEAVTSGVPVVAFPQWGDQVTDAVYLVDVWKVGVRVGRGEMDSRVVPREEVENCLRQAVAGPKSEEMKRKILQLKEAAAGAVAAGGSSYENVQSFVDEIKATGTRAIGIQVEVQPKPEAKAEAEVGKANMMAGLVNKSKFLSSEVN